MITLNLHNYQYFDRNPEAVKAINKLFLLQRSIEPRQISSSVGCTFSDSLDILFTIYAKELAIIRVRLYHRLHDFPIYELPMENGPPKFPVFCGECEKDIYMEESYYTLVFFVQTSITFNVVSENLIEV
ncbi:hypothetical protein Hgul01_05072 [Herpetosiphon gulosus]|uniref:Uncharacterized protein n=1 Tax=Herpetosiphon gulosus TaxID=1973496 RepID=A0ABP9X780_9CHLR